MGRNQSTGRHTHLSLRRNRAMAFRSALLELQMRALAYSPPQTSLAMFGPPCARKKIKKKTWERVSGHGETRQERHPADPKQLRRRALRGAHQGT